jgi:predicted porin
MTSKFIKALPALLGIAAALPVSAAQVELYGIIDMGLRMRMHDKIDGVKQAGTSVGMQTGQFYPNMFALKGSERLDSGLTVSFSLENRFNSDTGTFAESGRFFDNQALLMISGEKWTAAAGRMEGISSTMGEFDMAAPMDPFEGGWEEAGGYNVFANIGLSANNALALRVKPAEGLTVTGAYSLSQRDSEASRYGDNPHYMALGTLYQAGALMLSATYESVSKDKLEAGERTDHVFKVSANYDFGPARVFGAYQRTRAHKWFGQYVSADSYMLGLTAPVAGGLLRTSVQMLDGGRTQVGGRTFSPQRLVAAVGYTYELSKRTILWSTVSASRGRKSLHRNSSGSYAMADSDSRQEANRRMLSVGVTHMF